MVRQKGTKASYRIEPIEATAHAEGAVGTIAVIATPDASWAVASGESWLNIASGPTGNGSGEIKYNVSSNPTIEPREGVVIFRGGGIAIKHKLIQSGHQAVLDPVRVEFSANGGTGLVAVNISPDAVWQTMSLDNWIQVTSGQDGNGNGEVHYKLDPNNSVYVRFGKIKAAGKTHKITQKGRPAFIDSSHAGYGPDGGSQVVNVTTEANASWIADPKADWILLASDSSNDGSGVVMYVVAPFTSSNDSRTAVLEIAGQDHLVTQMGYEASIQPDVRNYSGAGGEGTVQVTVPRDATWKIISQSNWITVIGENSRNSSDQVTYTVAANTGAQIRTGTIIFSGRLHSQCHAATLSHLGTLWLDDDVRFH